METKATLNIFHYVIVTSLTCDSGSKPRLLPFLVKLNDFWLNKATALFDLEIDFGLSLDLMLLSLLWATSSDIALTRFSNRRLKVGYREIDLVIPWSLHMHEHDK